MTEWLTDRSSILLYQKCPRAYFWHRHFNGTGIEKTRRSLPLIFGSAFHEGAEVLLKGGSVDAAVLRAQLYLSDQFASVDESEAMNAYGMKEQAAIAEGLLRGWWLSKGRQFMEDFDILSVEEEGRADLGDGVILMYRPDAVVREKQTGDCYVLSWKTTSRFTQLTYNQSKIDMQSMSEVFGVQQQSKIGGIDLNGQKLNVEGVLYAHAVKGQRKDNDYLKHKVQETPLAYGWRKRGQTPEDDEWSWKFRWKTEEINEKGNLKETSLGKGWQQVLVSENYPGGVAAWVEALHNQEIAPRHLSALDDAFPQSLPVSRRADEIESWRRQTLSQQKLIRAAAEALKDAESQPQFDKRLDGLFPQSTARCYDWMSQCQFFSCCFDPAVKADPLASGLYQIRSANHPEAEEVEE